MNYRAIRKLPFPPTSHFTLEVVRQIKAIPDEKIQYTEEELAWIVRAIENLDYMIAHSKSCGIETEVMIARRSQFEVALKSSQDLQIGKG